MPIRRYLRVSKYTVLETRIFLDNPALVNSWFLNPKDPILPKVIDAVRPLVLPKLSEEIARSKAGGKKKKGGIKDVVVGDQFEVSIFLTQGGTRHAVLTKTRKFSDGKKLKSTSNKMMAADSGEVEEVEIRILREESVEDARINLEDIPAASAYEVSEQLRQPTEPVKLRRRSTRKQKQRQLPGTTGIPSSAEESTDDEYAPEEPINLEDDEYEDCQSLPHISGRQSKAAWTKSKKPLGREKDLIIINSSDGEVEPEAREDAMKKVGTIIEYDGFSLYGRILCLVVKRRDGEKGSSATATGDREGRTESLVAGQRRREAAKERETATAGSGGGLPSSDVTGTTGMMEEWIVMTQMAEEGEVDDNGED